MCVSSLSNRKLLKFKAGPPRLLNQPNYPVLSLIPSFSLSDVLCDPTDLIWRIGTPFEAMAGRTAPSLHGLLAEVFWAFSSDLRQMPRDLCTAPGVNVRS